MCGWCRLWFLVLGVVSLLFSSGDGLIEEMIDWATDRADKTLLTRCYDDYGCFSIGGRFISVQRPINLFPAHPQEIGLRFLLFTQNNIKAPQVIEATHSSIFNSSFILGAPIKFIIHGFLEDGERRWVKRMAFELLRRGRFNVVSVDWKPGAGPPYTQAVANTRLVGAMVAKFFKFLQENDLTLPPQFVHVIGHSLGAHVAGYIGERIDKLGRITGLDPALPYFENTNPAVRLDPTDAILVDVIHTDAGSFLHGGFGVGTPCGHIDFYPNGGTKQPGCADNIIQSINRNNGDIYGGMQNFIGCNHLRAHDYFTESVNPPCPFLAIQCESYEEFNQGSCFSCGERGDRCAPMGYHAILWQNTSLPYRNPVKMFLHTGSEAPFCRYHHHVTITMTDDPSLGSQTGRLEAIVTNVYGFTTKVQLNKEDTKFSAATTYTFVVGTTDSAPLRKLQLQWNPASSVLNQLTWRMLGSRRSAIQVDMVEIECLETGVRSAFCIGEELDGETSVTVMADRFCLTQRSSKTLASRLDSPPLPAKVLSRIVEKVIKLVS